MTDLLFKLIDRIIDLAKRREQQRVDFFRHFVEPAWKDFEAVHDNYLATFRKYLDLVSDSMLVLNDQHPVFHTLESDSLFSRAIRSRLAEVRHLQIEDENVHKFVQSIVFYLCSFPENSVLDKAFRRIAEADVNQEALMVSCLPRASLRHELRHAAHLRLAADVRRALAQECISSAVLNLQQTHGSVLECFGNLKRDLLKHAT